MKFNLSPSPADGRDYTPTSLGLGDAELPESHEPSRFRLHRDFPVNEAWAFRLDRGRKDFVPTAKQRYAGYIAYLAEWLFGK